MRRARRGVVSLCKTRVLEIVEVRISFFLYIIHRTLPVRSILSIIHTASRFILHLQSSISPITDYPLSSTLTFLYLRLYLIHTHYGLTISDMCCPATRSLYFVFIPYPLHLAPRPIFLPLWILRNPTTKANSLSLVLHQALP